MNRKIISLVMFLVLVFSVFLVSSFDESDKVDNKVYEELDKNEEVAVIIMVKEKEKSTFLLEAEWGSLGATSLKSCLDNARWMADNYGKPKDKVRVPQGKPQPTPPAKPAPVKQ